MLASTIAVSGIAAFASGGPVAPRTAEAAPAVSVTVRCEGAPEKTTIRNNTNRTVKVKRVGSVHEPRSNEPFVVNRNLGPKRSVTFESGSGADSNKLTGLYIYDNDVGSREGARANTSVGNFVGRC